MGITDINNTLNQMQNQTNQVQYETGKKNLGSSKIDKNAFLNLLLTQLKYQDPMNPVDDKEFISQQAQFTQIEKLDDINATLSMGNYISQASGLVGKKVDIMTEEGNTITGRIDSVLLSSKGAGLKIGDTTYSPDQITQIYAE